MRKWIGGSPCAGKSSVAALLAARHDLVHFACDTGYPARAAALAEYAMDVCDRLSRPPGWQAEREVAFYTDQFPLVLAELPAGPAVVEGADLLPGCLAGIGVEPGDAVWLVPTPEFQRAHYAARDWVGPYLAGCPDPAHAFENWMRRDILFARHVRTTAAAAGYPVIVVDGTRTVEETAGLVAAHLSL